MAGKAPLQRSSIVIPTTGPHPVLPQYNRSADDQRRFVTALFDSTARYYDWLCGMGSLGSGQFYRRSVLVKSGLRGNMNLLDVATGTGLVAKAALGVLRERGAVIGLDPSSGMLREARKGLSIPLVQGTVEELPFANNYFDFLSMGYALRHVADLGVAFRECLRVLKPGGRLLILEITRPRSTVGQWFLRVYFETFLPLITRLSTGSAQAELLMRYCWDAISKCVSPDTIVTVLKSSGFVHVDGRVRGGLLSEYTGLKPAQ